MITAVYKSGDKSDMSNYRGITVGSVIAKLFAMILDHRIAVWAEDEGIKAERQAGFMKHFCTTDNIFAFKSLCAHDSAAVRDSVGIPEIFYCLPEVKQTAAHSAQLESDDVWMDSSST